MSHAIPVRNPYTGAYDYSFTESGSDFIEAQCKRLRSAQPVWAQLPLQQRLEHLREFGLAVARRRADLIAALTTDTGRTQVPELEVEAVLGFIRRAANEAPQALAGSPARPAHIPLIHGNTRRIPFGLVGNISPWNFPLILSFLDTIPALASGNAVIIKPSEVTPRWIEPMRAAIAECPEVAAVLDIVTGTGQAGAAIPGLVDAVVFTGSVPTGRKVAAAAAEHFIPAYLELGGKDPAVVLASADVELAARAATFCAVQSTGQACQSLERIYVARALHDRFVVAAVTMAESLPINYPDINAGVVGPFIMEAQAHTVLAHVEDAVSKGATLHCGGELLDHGGLWMRPTVLTDVRHDMLLMQEETFGPVVPIMAFDSEADAVRLANDSKYGLSASIFAGSVAEAQRFSANIRAGAISINDAALTALVHEFEHDAFGYSGLGRSRSGKSAYTRFTREQSVMTNTESRPLLLNQLKGQ